MYAKYKDKIGHIIAAEVYQVWKKEILLLDDDGNELKGLIRVLCNRCLILFHR